ncbi:hypothetical protein HN011_010392 [Eciton burchellii]|nr:hypothetical protein HN011_010392 [Eciton burchellii]
MFGKTPKSKSKSRVDFAQLENSRWLDREFPKNLLKMRIIARRIAWNACQSVKPTSSTNPDNDLATDQLIITSLHSGMCTRVQRTVTGSPRRKSRLAILSSARVRWRRATTATTHHCATSWMIFARW